MKLDPDILPWDDASLTGLFDRMEEKRVNAQRPVQLLHTAEWLYEIIGGSPPQVMGKAKTHPESSHHHHG